MAEIAEIFRTYGQEFLEWAGDRLLGSQRRAFDDICRCRTPAIGDGTVYRCTDCGLVHFAWRSCGNRNCPVCGHEKTEEWLHAQMRNLLPVNYFMVTFTIPHELNSLAYARQKDIYQALFHASSESLRELARDKKFLGAECGMTGVLQTWSRKMDYHVHIHYLVPGGGISKDGTCWKYTKNRGFFVAGKALASLFKGKLIAEIETLGHQVPGSVREKKWIVDCKDVGDGRSSLKYLAPYIHRGPISDNRIIGVEGRQVTFTYKEAKTETWKKRTVDVFRFISLFMMHVLPPGFMRVRHYGFLASASKTTLKKIRLLVLTSRNTHPEPTDERPAKTSRCPVCGGSMKPEGRIRTQKRGPPPGC